MKLTKDEQLILLRDGKFKKTLTNGSFIYYECRPISPTKPPQRLQLMQAKP